MVGFGRKKKLPFSEDTALGGKGKVDSSSLLDDNGEPTSGSVYDDTSNGGGKKSAKKKHHVDVDDINDENKKPHQNRRGWFRLPGLKKK
jgi:hypothetical protein